MTLSHFIFVYNLWIIPFSGAPARSPTSEKSVKCQFRRPPSPAY